MVPSLFRYPVPPPATLVSLDLDTIHYAAREGIYTAQERDRSMNADLQIFIQYSLPTAIYSGKLNKITIMFNFENEKM